MAKELKTGWLVIATSGSVVYGKSDGRTIKKEWLEQMAENYNPNVFTARLWPEHRRWFAAGKILALKTAAATEPDLAGEIHLYAIIAPSDNLIEANKHGAYTYPSIEVGENYLGKGGYFLQGVGVTDEPASAGVSEFKFSKLPNNEQPDFIAQGTQFNLCNEVDEKKSLFDRFFPDRSTPKTFNEPSESETAMNEKQFAIFQDALAQQTAAVKALAEAFKTTGQPPAGDQPDAAAQAPTPIGQDEFNTLMASIEEQGKSIGALAEQFKTLLKEQPGTQVEETAGGDADPAAFSKTL